MARSAGGLAEPSRFTTEMYRRRSPASRASLAPAAALEALGVPDAERAGRRLRRTQAARLEALIGAGTVAAFPDALRFVRPSGRWAGAWRWRRPRRTPTE